MRTLVALDFETMPIVGNPILNPPAPIGLAVKYEGEDAFYITDRKEMLDELQSIWACSATYEMVFHNAPFDLRVAREHLGIEWPSWDRIHDTALSAYLVDPHSRTLSLKPLAERYCDIPPATRDELMEWILENVPKARERTWGRWIYKAPKALVAPYACDDVNMTLALHLKLRGQYRQEPYDLDRELMPYLVAETVRGVRLDRDQLLADAEKVSAAIMECDRRLRERLRQPASFGYLNVNSSEQLADALESVGAVDPKDWMLTPKGHRSTSRESLEACVKDPGILELLGYRSAMLTCHGTFMHGWLKRSEADGRLHPNWNPFKTTHGNNSVGTRTGRLSSDDPNFQNVPNSFATLVPEGMMPLPNMRSYVLPEEGHTWIKRDFDGQEMRILAHFEEGSLQGAFLADPHLDPHKMVQGIIHKATGVLYTRKQVKATGFGIIYGMGAPGLAKRLGIRVEESRALIAAYLEALPGVAALQAATKLRGRMGSSLRTFGGRDYFCEPEGLVDGEWRTWDYKLLNYLNQGSAADQTKRVLLMWLRASENTDAQFMATVHDEINISAPTDMLTESDACLKACMEADIGFDVPMTTTPSYGPNWGSLKENADE